MNRTHRIPLLKDHHNHLSYYALLRDCLDLRHTPDKTDALGLINSSDPDRISVILGWNSGYYEFEEQELAEFPPVIIVNISLHNFLISPGAEQRLAKDYPEIIANYRDPVWFDRHMPQMLAFAPAQIEPTMDKFRRFFDELYTLGVYHIDEMHLPGEKVYQVLKDSEFIDRTVFWTDPLTYRRLSPQAREGVKGMKIFTDGANGSFSAALNVSYLNGAYGELLYSDKELYKELRETSSSGLPAAVHAIGDRATSQVVRVVEQLKKDGFTFPQIRMEHCQWIDETHARIARDCNIILSMQPNFSDDSEMYTDRLPKEYLETNNPFRMLIDFIGFVPGENLLLGSDGMPHGAKGALQSSLFPPVENQRLKLEEFIAAYCMPDQSYGYIEFTIENKEILINFP